MYIQYLFMFKNFKMADISTSTTSKAKHLFYLFKFLTEFESNTESLFRRVFIGIEHFS